MSDYPFLCFDTEDDSVECMLKGDGFKKKVTQIAAITAGGNKYYNRGDVPAFKKWLRLSKEKYLYAHNLQYDLGNLFADELDTLDCTMVGGRLIKAVWGNKIFVDSFNIWPMSAKMLGNAFGLEKLETDSMATDKEYVYRDVEIIRAAMLFAWQFCDALGLKHLPPTLGGLCVKVWKHWGGVNCHDSNVLSREALYGGRVELFKAENESPHVCWTDINSLYPFVMQREFPAALEPSGTDLLKWGIARVTMHQPKTDLPTLPFRNDDGRILYPYGKFTGVWTIAEIRAAESYGAKLLKVHESIGTNEASQPYAGFVSRLYEARLASKSEAEKLFFKLLMNNLYGRLGTSGKIGRSVYQTDQNKYEGIPYGDKVMVTYHMPLSDETNWSHAAHVTAYGRLELLKYMRLIGAQRMIYCDTDSTIFDCAKQEIPFPTGTTLGEMKLESWETLALPFAPKMYRVGDKYKAKGVPKRLAKQFIETGHVEFDLPFKLREAIRFFDKDNRKKLSVWRKVFKMKRTDYDRKKLIGNRFYPCQVQAV